MTPRRLLLAFLALTLSLAVPAGVVRAEDPPAAGGEEKPAPKPPKKKAAAKKKTFDYDKSKYKSRELSQTPSYKFNEKGEPITAETKKKASVKKKRSEPPELGSQEGAGSCGSEENCAEKKSEADAL